MRTTDKPFKIDKRLVYEAYKAVKSNAGAAGVDGETIEQFEADLQNNLYKLWNRMSSGSYIHLLLVDTERLVCRTHRRPPVSSCFERTTA